MSEIQEMDEALTPELNSQEPLAKRPERHHRRPDEVKDKFYKMRQIFNIIFIVGAIIGVAVYLKNEAMGAVLIVMAMAFKMAECVIRFKK